MDGRMLGHILSLVGLVWYIAMWCIGILGCVSAYVVFPVFPRFIDIFLSRRRYRSRKLARSSSGTFPSPGVSILRPLKGLDTNLYENLESTFKQEYSNFEIIFSAADENDEALLVAQALMNRYPGVQATIITGMAFNL